MSRLFGLLNSHDGLLRTIRALRRKRRRNHQLSKPKRRAVLKSRSKRTKKTQSFFSTRVLTTRSPRTRFLIVHNAAKCHRANLGTFRPTVQPLPTDGRERAATRDPIGERFIGKFSSIPLSAFTSKYLRLNSMEHPNPPVFVSCVSHELGRIRTRVSEILKNKGLTPASQDILGTESGDLRQMLRDKIDPCHGLIHIVGHAYGLEPPTHEPEFGRVSYTQFEFRYALKKKKRTWLLFADYGCSRD
jgi:Domain of unknown function (DUF4062)